MGLIAPSDLPSDKLPKTSAEQTLWRNLQELQSELRGEKDAGRRKELAEQISMLKNQLSALQGPAYSELERENDRLKRDLAVAKAKLADVLRECSALKGNSALYAGGKETLRQERMAELQFQFYKLLLRRYADLINEFERKTVGELKALVNDKDLTVQSLLSEYKPDGYEFEKHYPDIAQKLFTFLQKEIDYVESDLELNFWLAPREILRGKMGDDEDMAVLLCSLLLGLGDENAEVVVAEMEDLKTHAFVASEFKNKFMLLDPTQGERFDRFAGEKKDVLQDYTFNGARIKRFLYKFSSTKYEQFI